MSPDQRLPAVGTDRPTESPRSVVITTSLTQEEEASPYPALPFNFLIQPTRRAAAGPSRLNKDNLQPRPPPGGGGYVVCHQPDDGRRKTSPNRAPETRSDPRLTEYPGNIQLN